MDLERMKAEFAARGGQITQADTGIAYGVDPEADKAKRAQARRIQRDNSAEQGDHEMRAEQAHEAFQEARMLGASMERAMDDYNFVRNRR